mmetsp:Transcript_19050/g.29218  ORF Transcript_19050/g.29218 Transcript_19050/m.29218 type:complete len:82 (+) Transcript_19050:11-256(+)
MSSTKTKIQADILECSVNPTVSFQENGEPLFNEKTRSQILNLHGHRFYNLLDIYERVARPRQLVETDSSDHLDQKMLTKLK